MEQAYLSQPRPLQEALKPRQSKRQILPPGSISTQDPTNTFGEFRNLTSTEVQYLRAGNKPYFRMTAEEKLNQALSQSDLMAQRKAVYDRLNSFMQNEYMPTITKDTQLQQMRERLQQLNLTINQNGTSFLNSLGFTEDKLRDPNLNPAIRNFISAGLDAWVKSQPEYQQIQQTNNNAQRYIQQTYPELLIKQKTLSNLANPQMKPTVPTYGDPSIQAQPINPTQQQAFDNAQSEAIKKANEEFKERISRPNRPFQQDPIVDPKREPKPSGPKRLTPIQPVQQDPIVDPIRPTLSAPPPPPIFTPDPALEAPKPRGPIVDPIRPTLSAPPPPPIFTPDPALEAPKPITPIVPKPRGPIVDPMREPYRPPNVRHSGMGPQGGLPKLEKPTTTGLMKQPLNSYMSRGYKNLNTNATKGLMNR